jgi:predicted NAD-dependent protein-ADP-ribosyltransferase YbiA (DUF1768 family)
MMIGLLAKFTQNKDLFKQLMDTGDKKIVEYSPNNDYYWATYWDHEGGKYTR